MGTQMQQTFSHGSDYDRIVGQSHYSRRVKASERPYHIRGMSYETCAQFLPKNEAIKRRQVFLSFSLYII